MKKTYEKPEIRSLEIKKEDIITSSYMLPMMPWADTDHGGETPDSGSESNTEDSST